MRLGTKIALIFGSIAVTLCVVEVFFQWNAQVKFLRPPKLETFPQLPVPLERWNIKVDTAAAEQFKEIISLNRTDQAIDHSKLFFLNGPEGKAQLGTSHYILRSTGKEYYKVQLEMDENGRRPVAVKPKSKDESILIFMGDSFTYGYGVKWSETFASRVSKKLGTGTYSTGMPGGGANSILERMERQKFFNDMIGKTATVIYTFIDLHVWRATCPSLCFLENSRSAFFWLPEYHLEEGKLVGGLPFYRAHPWRAYLSNFLYRSEFIRHFNLKWPPWTSEADLDLFAELIQEIRRRVGEQFTLERFLIVNYPGFSHQMGPRLKQRFINAGIEVLDLNAYDLAVNFNGLTTIPGDGHPIPEAHRILSEILVQELKKPVGTIGL